MKSLLSLIAIVAIFSIVSCQKPAESSDAEAGKGPNTLTAAEKDGGWELLFDGTSLNGWKQYGHDTITSLWSVRDSSIVCDGTGLGEGSGDHGGSLRTVKEYGNFD